MNPGNRQDMLVTRMGIDVLLEFATLSEKWWRVYGDGSALRSASELATAVRSTRRNLFGDIGHFSDEFASALIVAEGLREAAGHCNKDQGVLSARLTAAAEVGPVPESPSSRPRRTRRYAAAASGTGQ